MEKLTTQIEQLSLNAKTGVIYDMRMNEHKPLRRHPERPERLTAIINHLIKQKLFEKCEVISTCSEASIDIIQKIHSKSYLDLVSNLIIQYTENPRQQGGDSYYAIKTNQAAFLAVDALCKSVDNIANKKWDNAFAPVRPPGHHANAKDEEITGFCIYNNVAIGAKYAQAQYKEQFKKILIFDWDIHHGDSTQKFFYNDNNVLYCSIHKFENGMFYPGKSGHLENIGKEKGINYNINVPWNIREVGCNTVGDNEYIYILESTLMPIFQQFNPDLIFISAGFDSAWNDPLGGISVSPICYAYIVERLKTLANGKIIIGLEGGYNLESIAISAEYTLKALIGEKLPFDKSDSNRDVSYYKEKCRPNAAALILPNMLKNLHNTTWKILEDPKINEYHQYILDYNKKYLKEYKDDNHLLPVVYTKHNKCYTQHNKEHVGLLKKLTSLPSIIKKYLHSFYLLGEELLEDKKYLVFDNPFHDMHNASYWVVTFEATGYDEDDVVIMVANTNKLVIKDQNGKIIQLFDDKYDYGWNYKFDIDCQTQFEHLYYLLYTSNSNIDLEPDAHEHFCEFFKNLVYYVEDNKDKIHTSFKIFMGIDNITNKYQILFLNAEDHIINNDDSKYKLTLEGLTHLYDVFTNLRRSICRFL